MAVGGVVASGLGLWAYLPPWTGTLRIGTNVGRVAWHLGAQRALTALHLGAVLISAVLLLHAPSTESRRARTLSLAGVVAVLVIGVATALLVPWAELHPWAERPGRNLARPALVLEREGPFPELVGVNVRYGPHRLRLGSRPISGLQAGCVAAAHAGAGLLLVWACRRRRVSVDGAAPERDAEPEDAHHGQGNLRSARGLPSSGQDQQE